MDIQDKMASYAFMAEPFHCDFSKHIFLGHLGNCMLNAAEFHSQERGFGMDYLNPQHKTWVLSRLAIEMTDMPKMDDRFFIDTWVDGAMRYFTSRNFRVHDGHDHVYGYGRSMWAMIDTDTRQPADLFAIRDGLIKSYIDDERVCPIDQPSRVKIGRDLQLMRSLETGYSDVDINGHINSVKYIDHVLDLFPVSWYAQHKLRRFEIAYVAESHQGDVLHFYQEKGDDNETYRIKIAGSSGDDAGEGGVWRSLVDFVGV